MTQPASDELVERIAATRARISRRLDAIDEALPVARLATPLLARRGQVAQMADSIADATRNNPAAAVLALAALAWVGHTGRRHGADEPAAPAEAEAAAPAERARQQECASADRLAGNPGGSPADSPASGTPAPGRLIGTIRRVQTFAGRRPLLALALAAGAGMAASRLARRLAPPAEG